MMGLSRVERLLIKGLPVVSLVVLVVIFYLIFPIYEDLGGWIFEDLGSIPFVAYMPVGALLGYLLYVGMRRRRDLLVTYSRRIMVGMLVWFFLSIIVSLLTETGDVFSRMDSGILFKAWAVVMFVATSISPTLFGVYALLSKKRWAMGAAVTMFFILSIVCMIFSQGRYALAHSQDPFLSLLFIWSIIMFIESLSWSKRYIHKDDDGHPLGAHGSVLAGPLFRRQVYFTLLFTGFASAVSFTPVIMFLYVWDSPPSMIPYYELGTVFGKVIVALLLLVPLIIFTVVRRWMDLRSFK